MAFAAKKGSVTREDARLLLRISRSTATHYLSVLVQQGRLVMTGPKSETVYKVTGQ
jgi:predicted HTH transcriptional regulator